MRVREVLSSKAEELDDLFLSFGCDPTKWGDCNRINASLGLALKSMGKHVNPVSGYVNLDTPMEDPDSWEGEGISDPKHFWLSCGELVIDFAFQQFQGLLEEADSKNFIILEAMPKYICKKTWSVNNEFADTRLARRIEKIPFGSLEFLTPDKTRLQFLLDREKTPPQQKVRAWVSQKELKEKVIDQFRGEVCVK